MEVLKEEYNRLERQEKAYKKAILALPKGYLSKKNIRGNVSYYLQWREEGKIKSKYISKKDVQNIEEQLKLRKAYENSLRRVAEDKRRLEKVLEI